jgi:hypothetical protein
VEVKPQGVSKGKMVERILHELTAGAGDASPDFVLCIGNDRSGTPLLLLLLLCPVGTPHPFLLAWAASSGTAHGICSSAVAKKRLRSCV